MSTRLPPTARLMKPRHDRHSGRPLLAVLLASSSLAAPLLALAQPAAAPPSTVAPSTPNANANLVNRIVIRGNERIENNTVTSYLPVQVGTRVTDEQTSQAISALFATGLFSNVTISIQGTDMVVEVVENPIVNRVVFDGEKALAEDKLIDEVRVAPRGIFTVNRVQQDVQRLIELYRREGRISATVTPKIVELPQKRVDIIFEIDEGPRSGILDVNFLGNKAYSDRELSNVIVTEPSIWWKFFANNANYDPDRVDYDESQLRDFYRNRGYYDFKVESSVAELRLNRNAFVLTFTVDEGAQYHFGKATVSTELSRLDSQILQRLLPIKQGQLYSDAAIQSAQDSLVYAAGVAGFAFVDVVPEFVRNGDGTVDVSFKVTEGPKVYVERIDIIGNTTTLDRVIRREIELVEGDAFNQVLVDRSQNNIRGMGFFSDQKIERLPGSAPDRTVLRVAVTEQATGELALTAGYSSVDQLVVDFSVTQRNFRGRGENLSAQIRTGSFQRILNISFTEPKFLGRDLSGGFDIYSFRYDFTREANYTTTQTGGQLRVGFPLSENSTLNVRYALRADDLTVQKLTCNLTDTAICSQLGTKITSSVGWTWLLNRTRGDALRPTRGFTISASQDFAGIGGDTRYIRTEANGSWFYGFNKDFIFTARGAGGYIDAYAGENLRISDRFFKGGQTFRGFETAGLGPRDTTFNSSLGGKIYGIGTLELTVPTFLPPQFGIDAALFTDFGTLGGVDPRDKIKCTGNVPPICSDNPAIKDSFALRGAAGVSIGWKSPLGPIQFDLSRVYAKTPYDRTQTFQFRTRSSF